MTSDGRPLSISTHMQIAVEAAHDKVPFRQSEPGLRLRGGLPRGEGVGYRLVFPTDVIKGRVGLVWGPRT